MRDWECWSLEQEEAEGKIDAQRWNSALLPRQGLKRAMSPASAGKLKRGHGEESPQVTRKGLQSERQKTVPSAIWHTERSGVVEAIMKGQHEKIQDKDRGMSEGPE